MNPELNGVIAGYDPGGNGSHGVASLTVVNGQPVALVTETLATAETVIDYLGTHDELLGLGVDTLTCWSTGAGGWRPADRWLRQQYPEVQSSVVTPNGLFGSMGLNGMAVLISARARTPSLWITETHPKVMHWHFAGTRYDFENRFEAMNLLLSSRWHVPLAPCSEHEWDAAISAYSAFEGLMGNWSRDLHQLPCSPSERIVSPCGATRYVWPK